MAGLPDVRSLDAARLLSAAGLDTEAADLAHAALATPPEEPIGNDLGLIGRSEGASLLPTDEAIAELLALRGGAADVRDLYWRASVLVAVAARLQPLDPSLAADTLHEAFLTGWLGGRGALMDVFAAGPIADLGSDLPALIARWIPEIDAWWAE